MMTLWDIIFLVGIYRWMHNFHYATSSCVVGGRGDVIKMANLQNYKIANNFVIMLMRHNLSHYSFLKFACRSFKAVFLLNRTAVSSTKIAFVVDLVVGRSNVYSKHNTGPTTLPCGTPDRVSCKSVHSPWCFTNIYRVR